MRAEPTYYISLEPAKRLSRKQAPLLIIALNGSVGSTPEPMAWLIFSGLAEKKNVSTQTWRPVCYSMNNAQRRDAQMAAYREVTYKLPEQD